MTSPAEEIVLIKTWPERLLERVTEMTDIPVTVMLTDAYANIDGVFVFGSQMPLATVRSFHLEGAIAARIRRGSQPGTIRIHADFYHPGMTHRPEDFDDPTLGVEFPMPTSKLALFLAIGYASNCPKGGRYPRPQSDSEGPARIEVTERISVEELHRRALALPITSDDSYEEGQRLAGVIIGAFVEPTEVALVAYDDSWSMDALLRQHPHSLAFQLHRWDKEPEVTLFQASHTAEAIDLEPGRFDSAFTLPGLFVTLGVADGWVGQDV